MSDGASTGRAWRTSKLGGEIAPSTGADRSGAAEVSTGCADWEDGDGSQDAGDQTAPVTDEGLRLVHGPILSCASVSPVGHSGHVTRLADETEHPGSN